MLVCFNPAPAAKKNDAVICTALTGVVYTENNRLHIKCNNRHLIYKFDGSPIGWYERNLKTNDDIYLGEYACPTALLESIDIKDEEYWNSIILQDQEDEEEVE